MWFWMLIVVLAAFGILNVAAFGHAYLMTHVVPSDGRPEKPEARFLRSLHMVLFGIRLVKKTNTKTPGDAQLPFEAVSFKSGDGVALEGWHTPAEHAHGTIILFHGYNGSRESLIPEAGMFHELGWSTLLIDLRASGDSEGKTTTIGYREGLDVAAAVSWVRERRPKRPLMLFGVSMGAAAILRAIHSQGVQADGVILECPFDTLTTAVRRRFHIIGIPDFPAAYLMVFWGGVMNGFWGFGHAPVRYARAVTCPCLVLHGREDERVSVAEVRSVADQIAGEEEFYVFDGVGHESYYQALSEEYRSVITAWLVKHDVAASLSE